MKEKIVKNKEKIVQYSIVPAIVITAIAAMFSGIAGLSYEISWSRMLVIPLGNSSDATTVILCTFMLGMAIGSKIMGELADRFKAPLKIYIGVELFLATYAILVPFVLPSLESSLAFAGNYDNFFVQYLFRFFTASLVIIIPSILMGATIPVLVKGLSLVSEDIKKRVGLLYGCSTIGGAIGAGVCGFWAVPTLGLKLTSFVAACFSILAAFLLLFINTVYGAYFKGIQKTKEIDIDNSKETKTNTLLALLIAGVGGFAMLGAEIVFIRVFSFVFGHDAYAFSILLVVVLLGLGLGGLVHRMLKTKNQLRLATWSLMLVGVTIFLSFLVFSQIIIQAGRDPFRLDTWGTLATSLRLEFWREITLAPFLAFIPSVFSGISLSAAAAACGTQKARAGSLIGNVFFVNGAAAAAGAFLCGSVMVPVFGISSTMLILGMLAVITSSSIFIYFTIKKQWAVVPALIVAGASVILVIFFPKDLPRQMLLEAVGKRHQKIVHYQEGRTCTASVTVNKINKERQLFVNSVNEVTTRLVHVQSFKLLGHLGPLLHPRPESGLVICFGAGISSGAAVTHPFKKIDIVDLSSSVFGAEHHFRYENNNVLKDSRVKTYIEDGRQFLLRSDEKYDVMMIDSTHPKAVDSWILYTTGFYETVRSRMTQDGIVVQWLPLHGLSETEFKIIVNTFLNVFPEMTMWLNVGFEVYGKAAYAKLVGTLKPLEIDFKELALRIKEPSIEQDLKKYGMDSPFEILDSFLASSEEIKKWVSGVSVQTDNRPFISYITRYSKGPRMDAASLIPVRSSVIPYLYNIDGREREISSFWEEAYWSNGFLMSGLLDQAYEMRPSGKKIKMSIDRFSKGEEYYLELADLYKDKWDKLFEIANYLGNLGYPKTSIPLYKKALEMSGDNVLILINMALAYLDLGELKKAYNTMYSAVSLQPENALANYNFGVVKLVIGDAKSASVYLYRALAINPLLHNATLSLADAHRQLGQSARAKVLLQGLTAMNPLMARAWDTLGVIYAEENEYDRAIQNHKKALEIDPYNADTHYNIGLVFAQLGQLNQAAGAFQTSLTIKEDDPEVHNNLGLVLGRMGMVENAVENHLRALEIEPIYPQAAFNLGLAYRALDEFEKAATFFALALKLNPELKEAARQMEEMGVVANIELEAQEETEASFDTQKDISEE